MKNRRWMNGKRMAMCLCGLMTWFFVMPAMAVDQPAPGKAKLKVERKEITQQEAATLIGQKVTLGVYLVLDANWNTALESGAANRVEGQMSFAFFENATKTAGYTASDFLQNPADYIEICADPNAYEYTPIPQPRPTCCTDATTSSTRDWYTGVTWQNPSATSNGSAIGWPDYAYGNLFLKQNQALLPQDDDDKTYYRYWKINDDGTYEFKLFDIQFVLKNIGSRNAFPVAILDDRVQVQGALAATELNIMKGNDKYWPSGAPAKPDWTDLVGTYFEFVPGGLFIQTGPEVGGFEPKFC